MFLKREEHNYKDYDHLAIKKHQSTLVELIKVNIMKLIADKFSDHKNNMMFPVK